LRNAKGGCKKMELSKNSHAPGGDAQPSFGPRKVPKGGKGKKMTAKKRKGSGRGS